MADLSSQTMPWKRTMSSTRTRQKWSTERHSDSRWIKEALWIRKTPMCINQDAGSYQLSYTWDQVISRSRAPSSCKQSTRRDLTDIETLSLGNNLSCVVRSFYIIEFINTSLFRLWGQEKIAFVNRNCATLASLYFFGGCGSVTLCWI